MYQCKIIKTNMKKSFILIALLSLGFIFSCDKELEKTNPSVFTTDNYFGSTAELENGVNATYSILTGTNLYGRELWWVGDMRGDEMASGGGQLEAVDFYFNIEDFEI